MFAKKGYFLIFGVLVRILEAGFFVYSTATLFGQIAFGLMVFLFLFMLFFFSPPT